MDLLLRQERSISKKFPLTDHPMYLVLDQLPSRSNKSGGGFSEPRFMETLSPTRRKCKASIVTRAPSRPNRSGWEALVLPGPSMASSLIRTRNVLRQAEGTSHMLMLLPWLKSLALLVAGRSRSDRETVCHRSGARGGDGIGDGDRLSAADVKRAHPQVMGFIGALGKGGYGRA